MSQIPPVGDHGQEPGWSQRGAGFTGPRLPASLRPDELPLLGAAVIVLAVLVILLGALIVGLATDVPGDDEWKFRVKTIGLGTGGSLGSLGAPFVAVALLLALGFVSRPVDTPKARWARVIEIGALAAAAWLVLFTLLGVLVDLTEMGDAFPEAIGALLVDLGALLLLAVTGLWGLRALTTVQRR